MKQILKAGNLNHRKTREQLACLTVTLPVLVYFDFLIYWIEIKKLIDDLDRISDACPHLISVLKEHEIETFVACRVGMGPLTFGYIMCAEPRSLRIWQDDEFAILFSLSRMLAGQIRGVGLKLE